MKVSQAVVKVIEEWNVPYIYGIPGGQTLYFTEAVKDSKKVEFIPVRQEGTAAGAADAYGRLTGKPGLCLATTGPGATNLITSIGGAFRDSSPMIAFVFQNTLAGASRGDAQESDHQQLFQSLVKKYIPIRSSDVAVYAMREAYRIATTGKPGPVVVDFYRDVIENGECEYELLKVENYAVKNTAVPSAQTLEALVNTLNSYKKIVIWSGNGVKMSHTGNKVVQLAKRLNAPIVTTFNGISSVPTSEELVLGARSRHGTKVTRAALEEADCVLVLGSSMSSVSTNRWGLKLKNIVQIDFEASQIANQYPVVMGVCAELGQTLDALNKSKKLRNSNTAQDKWTKDILKRQKAWKKNVFSKEVNDEKATPCAPVAVARKLNEVFKDDEIICCDAGNPGAWTHLFDYTEKTNYFKPVNFGNMGFSIPAGIGCSMAEPKREVITLIGDGSLGMTLGDLETVAKYSSKNHIIVVLNDHAYGNIKQEIEFKFGKNMEYGVDLKEDVHYSEVAKAFGIGTCVVEKAEDIPAAFEKAREFNGPFMIEIEFDGSYNIWPEAFCWNE